MNKKSIIVGVFRLLIAGIIFAGFITPLPARAQTSYDPWTTPVNLSHSGSTNDPFIVVDSNGLLHVIWYDSLSGNLYSKFDGNTWSQPVVVDFPFPRSSKPTMVADDRGYIYAFWISNQSELSYSFVPVIGFNKKVLWSKVQVLGDDVQGFNLTTDAEGYFHLVYVRTNEISSLPAGIYYRKSRGAGYPWTKNTLLYSSRYFRSLNVDGAHAQVATTQVGDQIQVYVTWDNRPLKQVFLTKSTDGGLQWEAPVLIDGPSESFPNADPFNIQVYPDGEDVLLFWQSGMQSGVDCVQNFKLSTNLGETWSEQQELFEEIAGCPQNNQFFKLDGGIVLMTTIQDQVFLSAWNKQEWSATQSQPILSSFSDPDVFDTVLLRCLQSVLVNGRLHVVGCDNEGDGDIWITSRPLDLIVEFFGGSTSWSVAVSLVSEQKNIRSAKIICSADGFEHILWSQVLASGRTRFDKAIFYSRLEENGWTQPTRVLNTPDTRAVEPDIVQDVNHHLYAVWGSRESGEVYFATAEENQAHNSFNWSKPLLLPAIHPTASSPSIVVDPTGRIFVAYALVLNENRGIYLTRSDDRGKTWQPPVFVFDAALAGWHLADQPKLARTDDGVLHLTWLRSSISESSGFKELYYARSTDDGQTWSQPVLVTEEPLAWGLLISVGENTIHRFWSNLGQYIGVWHDYSIDSGISWSTPTNLSALGETPVLASVVPDSEGRLHLVQSVVSNSGDKAIKYMVWNGASWLTEDVLNINTDDPAMNFSSLSHCINSDNQLAVIYALASGSESSEEDTLDNLILTSRAVREVVIESPVSVQFIQPTAEPLSTASISTATAEVLPTETPLAPAATPTPPAATAGSTTDQILSLLLGTPWVGIALGLALALIIVILAFSLRMRKMRGHDTYW